MSSTAEGPAPGERVDAARWSHLHRAFRPRRSRRVALGVGMAQMLVMAPIALLLPAGAGTTLLDRALLLATSLLIGGVLLAVGSVRAVPDDAGLSVRNVVGRRRLEWAEILSVRLAPGDPWARLDLADGGDLPVMAIQRSDGPLGDREASRLAALVAVHDPTRRNGPDR